MDEIKTGRSRSKMLPIVWCLVALFVFQQPVYAEATHYDSFVKPMPSLSVPDDYGFESKSELYQRNFPEEYGLSYKIRLPSGWQKKDVDGGKVITFDLPLLSEISRFFGPARGVGPRSFFKVSVATLPYHLTAEQWALQHVIENGYTLQGIKTENDQKTEILFIMIIDDISYIARAHVESNGRRVVMAEYYVPVDFIDQEAVDQLLSIRSFELLDQREELPVNLKAYHFLDIAKAQYPATWELRAPPIRSVDRFGVTLLNISRDEEDTDEVYLNGRITVDLVSQFESLPVEEELAAIRKKQAESQGLVLSKNEDVNFGVNYHEAVKFAHTEVSRAEGKGNEIIAYEFWTTVVWAGQYYYFATLLTPARDQNFFTWSQNTQTYKLFLELLEPFEDTLVAK